MDAVKKMESRYHLLSEHKVRNIEQYNHAVAQVLKEKKGKLTDEEAKTLRPLPYIVIIIDELAELMMVSAQDVDYAIARLAQLARAVGIHLVLATQRPSIDVITGTIKNNFSSRIAFRVPSKIDSRVILDTRRRGQTPRHGRHALHAAELSAPHPPPLRVCLDPRDPAPGQVRARSRARRSTTTASSASSRGPGRLDWGDDGEKDERYDEAVELILHTGQASASYLQRKLKLGYARASRIIDQMEQEGILGPSEGSKPREILIDVKQWREQQQQQKKKGSDD